MELSLLPLESPITARFANGCLPSFDSLELLLLSQSSSPEQLVVLGLLVPKLKPNGNRLLLPALSNRPRWGFVFFAGKKIEEKSNMLPQDDELILFDEDRYDPDCMGSVFRRLCLLTIVADESDSPISFWETALRPVLVTEVIGTECEL